MQVGLILVDRNTVVVGPCDVNISFGAHPCEVPGTVRCGSGLLIRWMREWLSTKLKRKWRVDEVDECGG